MSNVTTAEGLHTTDAPTAAPYRLRWLVAAVVLAANLMDVLDATIVNVAGPSIHRDLGGGADTIQWLSAGYTLAFAVLLIAGARLGDIYGRRRLFILGEAGFTVFSAAVRRGAWHGRLIVFRALQGAFGALMIPQGFGLMKQVFDDEELGKAMGLFGPATGLPMLAAPVLAGALVDANLWGIGWRLVFLINIPIGVAALPLAIRSLPRGASHEGGKLDFGGVALIGLALVAIIYPLIQGRSDGWPAWSFVTSGRRRRAPDRFRTLRAPTRRQPPDRAEPVEEPHLSGRRRRDPGAVRRLQRTAAVCLALRPARPRLVADSRRPDPDPDDRRNDRRNDGLPRPWLSG